MRQTKLISVRIDSDILQRIDQICRERDYLNRNAIINRMLGNTIACMSTNDFYDLIQTHDAFSDGYSLILRKKIVINS